MSKHTPGPWLCTPSMGTDGHSQCVYWVWKDLGEEDGYEGLVADNSPEARANARLIAAAPNLLKALKDCLDALGDDPGCYCDDRDSRCEDCEPFRQVQERAEAAIKKAGG